MDRNTVLTRLAGRMGEIRRRFRVKAISIFGSTVRGEATDNSDVDVLVVFDCRSSFDLLPGIEWRKAAGLRDMVAHAYFGIDNDILWE